MMYRNAIVGGLALIATASGLTGASAQTQPQPQAQGQSQEQVLVAASVDCRYQLRPVETAICSTPVLAAMDIQMVTLFNTLNLLVKPEVGVDMAAKQQDFLKARESCGPEVNCIGQATAERISELDAILKDIASRGPY